MALSREKAKKPSKGLPVKAPKLASKVAKPAKNAAAAKTVAPVKAKAQKPAAIPAKAVKSKAVAAQQLTVSKKDQVIAKAKAALKVEATAVETATPAAPAKPISKAKARKIMIEASINEAASALAAKWATLYKKAEQIDAKPYNMKAVFEEKTAIVHKVLGWGYILANRNDRLEVLFKDGIKHLISNYKP